MMTLIALAISVAFVFSAAVTLGYPGHAALGGAGDAGHDHAPGPLDRDALDLAGPGRAATSWRSCCPTPRSACDGERASRRCPIGALATGDVVLVRPGAGVPADGMVREGASAVNESMITGESRPVKKTHGRQVIAGTVNGAGSLRVAGHRHRRADRARRHHAAGRAGADARGRGRRRWPTARRSGSPSSRSARARSRSSRGWRSRGDRRVRRSSAWSPCS